MALPGLSVIVPVRNHAEPLRRLLERLGTQKPAPNWDVEVLVIDNNSTDNTADVIRSSPFRYVFCEELGVGAARNAGVKAANGRLLYFMDADTLPESDEHFLRITEVATRIGAGRFGAFGGAVTVPPNQRWNPVALADHWACWFNWHPKRERGATRLFQPGLSLAVARHAFDAVGGFDNSITIMQDMEFQHRLQQKGYAIFFAPRLVIMHEARSSLWRSWEHSWSWGAPFRERYLPTAPDYGLKYPVGDKRFWRNLPMLFRRRMRLISNAARQNDARQLRFCYPFLAATVLAWTLGVIWGKERRHEDHSPI